MDVALAFVCLSNEEICHMSSNSILVADSIATEYFLQAKTRLVMRKTYQGTEDPYMRALTNARSQLCRFTMDIISGAALPSSFRRPT